MHLTAIPPPRTASSPPQNHLTATSKLPDHHFKIASESQHHPEINNHHIKTNKQPPLKQLTTSSSFQRLKTISPLPHDQIKTISTPPE
jgi:hypothetical protein